LSDAERQKAYRSDITYGTNNEFGFDYLRDNMKFRLEDLVQREFNYAIVDEVDSILIDEARTPLIIQVRHRNQPSFTTRLTASSAACIRTNILSWRKKPGPSPSMKTA